MRKLAIALVALLACAGTATASPIIYEAALLAANENPPTASTATGFARVTVDQALNTMLVEVNFSGLVAGNTASHIHCCAVPPANAGVATTTPTFTGFPTGATSGSYTHLFNMLDPGSYNPAFIALHTDVATSEAFLFNGMALGQTYLNIHSTTFGGGEIRGFLTAVPEPGTITLLGLGLGVAGILRRKVRS